jgi:predicted TIM-barrel fold metal-dependent hydrolase
MLTRREMMAGAAGVCVAASGWDGARAEGPKPKTKVTFEVPRGACDCHVHVIGDPEKYPMFSGRNYTPPPATADELLALQKTLGLDRVVVVTPSTYGIDNSATLDAIKQLGRERARGVVVVDPSLSADQLAAMAKAGVSGIRVNLEQAGVFDPAAAAKRLQTGFELAKAHNWHVQIYSRPAVIGAVASELQSAPVPLVFDHFGGADSAAGVQQPGFDTVVSLVKSGRAYAKLSGSYRASKQAPDYPDVLPLAKALLEANPDRLVWGSDWPHPDSVVTPNRKATDTAPYYPLDDGHLLSLLGTWVPDAGTRRKILVDNPARLYGF